MQKVVKFIFDALEINVGQRDILVGGRGDVKRVKVRGLACVQICFLENFSWISSV